MPVTLDPAVARVDHQRAVAEILAAARALTLEQWERAPDPQHWSPAQIAQHVRLTYEVVAAQYGGGPGIRVRTSAWLRPILRWKFLSAILESGRFPSSARAPSEIRPGNGPFDRERVLTALEAAAMATEQQFVERWTDTTCLTTHHVFGALRPPEGARLVTVHTAHHAAQLRAVATPEQIDRPVRRRGQSPN